MEQGNEAPEVIYPRNIKDGDAALHEGSRADQGELFYTEMEDKERSSAKRLGSNSVSSDAGWSENTEQCSKNDGYSILNGEKKRPCHFNKTEFILRVFFVIAVGAIVTCFVVKCHLKASSQPSVIFHASNRSLGQMQNKTPRAVPRTGVSEDMVKLVAKSELIEVSGFGGRHTIMRKGKKFSHWDVRTRRGAVDLHSFTYIVIEKPGIYHIYSQIAAFAGSSPRSLSFAVMKNSTVLNRYHLINCNKICTQFTSRMSMLRKGDHIYIKTSTGGDFIMDSNLTYFGVTLV